MDTDNNNASQESMRKPRRVNKLWFDQQLSRKDVSQAKLAKYMRLDKSSVTRILQGQRSVKVEEAAQIAKFLGQPLMDVMEHLGLDPKDLTPRESGLVRISGYIDEHGKVHTKAVRGAGYVTAPPDVPDDTVALRYHTALTPLDLLDGRTLFYEPRDTVSADAIGRLCVVQLVNGDQHVCFVRRSHSRGSYVLVSEMGDTRREEVLTSASPVLWIQP